MPASALLRFKWTIFAFDKRGQSISATRVQFVMETMSEERSLEDCTSRELHVAGGGGSSAPGSQQIKVMTCTFICVCHKGRRFALHCAYAVEHVEHARGKCA